MALESRYSGGGHHEGGGHKKKHGGHGGHGEHGGDDHHDDTHEIEEELKEENPDYGTWDQDKKDEAIAHKKHERHEQHEHEHEEAHEKEEKAKKKAEWKKKEGQYVKNAFMHGYQLGYALGAYSVSRVHRARFDSGSLGKAHEKVFENEHKGYKSWHEFKKEAERQQERVRLGRPDMSNRELDSYLSKRFPAWKKFTKEEKEEKRLEYIDKKIKNFVPDFNTLRLHQKNKLRRMARFQLRRGSDILGAVKLYDDFHKGVKSIRKVKKEIGI